MPEYLNPALVTVLSSSESIGLIDSANDLDHSEIKRIKDSIELKYVKALMQLCLNCPGLFNQNEF